VILLFLCNSLAVNPPRPQIVEVFVASGDLQIKFAEGPFLQGNVTVAIDSPKGLGREEYMFPGENHLGGILLQRFDLNKTFELDTDDSNCKESRVHGAFPKIWHWISDATFVGAQINWSIKANVWTSMRGYANLSIGVSLDNPNIPLWTAVISRVRERVVIFKKFQPITPNSSIFDIPSECQNLISLTQSNLYNRFNFKCISRSTIISRAQKWVNEKVPYNQDGHHDGYREDCSGYVSMAWNISKPGLTTQTLPRVSHKITKDELQHGDVLLNEAEHVVLFGGWTDTSHSHYIAYEETKPGEGTVKRMTPYPYWYNTVEFVPYRLNEVC